MKITKKSNFYREHWHIISIMIKENNQHLLISRKIVNIVNIWIHKFCSDQLHRADLKTMSKL